MYGQCSPTLYIAGPSASKTRTAASQLDCNHTTSVVAQFLVVTMRTFGFGRAIPAALNWAMIARRTVDNVAR